MVKDSKFSNTILTNIGHQMLTSISNGNRKITYTKAEAYAQDVSSISNETLQALTSLQGKELSANLLVSNDSGNVVTITANFRNKGLTNDVIFNSIGWFAKLDTDDAERGITANQEYLIGITPASGTQTLVAPPADQSSSQAISIKLNMTVSDASNVNMTVSDAGAVHFNQLDDQLAKYTTKADLTKLLAGKADLGLSYTKAEIDAKLLNLSTDTDGKVSADQVQALISDKANISDVYTKNQVDSALSTRDAKISDKANISDVYTKRQVDSALSTRDTQISTKANISDVYTKSDVDNALAVDRGRLGKLEGTQTLDSPDFNSITSTGVYYITNNTPAKIKNNPASQWGVLVVSNGNENRTSQVYYPDDGSPQWCRLLNGSNWLPWYQLSTKKDVSNATAKLADVLAQLTSKADTSTVNAQIADAKNTAQRKLDQAKSDLTSLIDNIKNFNVDSYKGAIPSTDMNKITDAGLYGFSDAILTNAPYTGNRSGLLLVIREFDNDPNNIDQFITSNGSLFWRNISLTNNRYPNWNRFADDGDVAGLKDQINTKANASDLSALDSKAVKSIGIYPNDLNFTNGQFTNWSSEMKASPDDNGYALIDLTDDASAQAAVNQLNAMLTGLNHLQGKQTKDSADANALSETGIYYCSNPDKNFPVVQWGTLVTSNGNGERASQLYFPDDNTAVWFRTFYKVLNQTGDWRGWVRLANIDDVNNAKSSLTSSIDAVSNKVNVTVPLFRRITAANTWNDILGTSNGNTPVLISIRDEGGGNTIGSFSSAVAFGGADTKGVLNVAYSDHKARIIGGNGNAPAWHEDIAWKSDIDRLQSIINQQSQTIQSLTSRLNNAENEINYIKSNYVEGRRFPASQEAQAEAWENANPQGVAFITSN